MNTPKLTVELCNDIYQDFLLNPRDENGNLRGHKPLLAAVGAGKLIEEFGSRASIKTSPGFRRVAALVRKNLPQYLELLYAVKSGTVKPLTNVPDKTAWLKPFLKTGNFKTESDIWFGLEITKGREDFFKSKHYQYFYLRIKNGANIEVSEFKFSPLKNPDRPEWSQFIDLDILGDDDDYLLEYGYGKDGWFRSMPRTLGLTARKGVVKINGAWLLVDYDDIDENGEYMGDDTDPDNIVTVEPPSKERIELNRKKKEEWEREERLTKAVEKGIENIQKRVAEKEPDPAIVKEAWDIYSKKQNTNKNWGEDWYRCLLAFGEDVYWGGNNEPGEAFVLEDFLDKEKQWKGWRRFRQAYERMGGV